MPIQGGDWDGIITNVTTGRNQEQKAIRRLFDLGNEIADLEKERTRWTFELSRLLGSEPRLPTITAYSQNNPLWAGQIYAGGYTFARAGCYTVDVAMVTSLAGYTDTPPQVAAKMRTAKCFSGADLLFPQNIPVAYPKLMWPSDAYYNRPGAEMPADKIDLMRIWLDTFYALIIKVDYKPANYKYDMHFVLAVGHSANDFEIIDPLDGKRTSLLERYGAARGWTIQQCIFGYRGLRVIQA